jgi:hypothetical protein
MSNHTNYLHVLEYFHGFGLDLLFNTARKTIPSDAKIPPLGAKAFLQHTLSIFEHRLGMDSRLVMLGNDPPLLLQSKRLYMRHLETEFLGKSQLRFFILEEQGRHPALLMRS